MKKLLLMFAIATLAVSLASAKSYGVTLFQASVVGGTELKAGEYKLEVNSDKARIWNGRQSGEAAVKVQNVEKKYSSTSVKYGANNRIAEIRVGGTTMLLLFPES